MSVFNKELIEILDAEKKMFEDNLQPDLVRTFDSEVERFIGEVHEIQQDTETDKPLSNDLLGYLINSLFIKLADINNPKYL